MLAGKSHAFCAEIETASGLAAKRAVRPLLAKQKKSGLVAPQPAKRGVFGSAAAVRFGHSAKLFITRPSFVLASAVPACREMQPRCQPRSRQEQILLIPNLGRAQRDFPCIFEALRVQRWPDRSRQ